MPVMHIPIDLYVPKQSSSVAGNCYWNVSTLTALDDGHWEFVKDVDGYIYGRVLVPNNLAASPAAKIELSVKAPSSGGNRSVRFKVAAHPVADGESMNPSALCTPIEQLLDLGATEYARGIMEFTLPVTGSFPIVAGDLLLVEICHYGSHISDLLAVNCHLDEAYLVVEVV
jgi:hypothetical protein